MKVCLPIRVGILQATFLKFSLRYCMGASKEEDDPSFQAAPLCEAQFTIRKDNDPKSLFFSGYDACPFQASGKALHRVVSSILPIPSHVVFSSPLYESRVGGTAVVVVPFSDGRIQWRSKGVSSNGVGILEAYLVAVMNGLVHWLRQSNRVES